MAKTITQMAEELFPPTMMTGHNCVFDVNEEKRRVFELGANAVLEEIEKCMEDKNDTITD